MAAVARGSKESGSSHCEKPRLDGRADGARSRGLRRDRPEGEGPESGTTSTSIAT